MNCHQILTGAVNSGDNCFSIGSVEGVPFASYAAGCNIVILASDFSRVQILPGILHGNVQVTCLDCSTDVGKIAVAFGREICIFEPTPLLNQTSGHKLDYKWIQTATLQSDCPVSVLSWNLEGTKLLSGGSVIQMWQLTGFPDGQPHNQDPDNSSSQNQNQQEKRQKAQINLNHDHEPDDHLHWDCVWRCRTANPVFFLEFSPDGSLFISAGKSDRLVKIWYESAAKNNYLNGHGYQHPGHPTTNSGANSNQQQQQQQPQQSYHPSNNPMVNQISTTHPLSEVCFSFVYIAHPRAVTGISWRATSKYTPRGCNANMLVTSSKDNICRIWIQTLLPDDGMVNVSQIDELAAIPRVQTQRHRQKLLQRIRHMRSFNQFRKRHAKTEEVDQAIPNLPSTYSVHDFHTFGVHGASMTPGLHFHLAAAINAETDIPLVPSISSVQMNDHTKPNFVMHWLNNKEMTFTRAAEKLLHDVSLKIFQLENPATGSSGNASDGSDTNGEEVACDALDHDHGACEEDGSPGDSKKKLKSKPIKSPRKPFHLGKHLHKDHPHEIQEIHSKHPLQTAPSSASLRSDATSGHDDHSSTQGRGSTLNVPPAASNASSTLSDYLDRKFESMLRKWQTSSDVLFSIHPVDGSLLVWLVDWLDETCPGSFRQAQVNFSTRIPNAIPLGDASTMSHKVVHFSPYSFLDIRTLSGPITPSSPTSTFDDVTKSPQEAFKAGANHSSPSITHIMSNSISALPTPTVYMVTKHINGTLNQWAMSFAESTNFTQVLSVSHKKRVCGHRFRVNDIACHPVLPLLLTTSHHNLPGGYSAAAAAAARAASDRNEDADHNGNKSGESSGQSSPAGCPSPDPSAPSLATGFCSELILWKVDSVGPLSKSGGVTELARINSPNVAAFANVAWIPTLLPSSTLGSIANSPSACFIASDGEQLRVYQAIIDARTLLAEMSAADRRKQNAFDMSASMSEDNSSVDMSAQPKNHLRDVFRIVSLQSTSRPGCILELPGISNAVHDWQNTQLLHVFQDQLIRGDRAYKSWAKRQQVTGLTDERSGAVVDLRHSAVFEEPFYLVVIEKSDRGQSVIHMWKLVISSQSEDNDEAGDELAYVPDSNLIQEESDHSNQSSRSGSPTNPKYKRNPSQRDNDNADAPSVSPLKITTIKVSSQVLPLPEDVEVIHATPAAGHLSSSNIYPACFAPYLISTACSDGTIRFWRCESNKQRTNTTTSEFDDADPEKVFVDGDTKFKWVEWKMLLNENSSAIEVPGQPLFVSCAFSGRMACAYKYGQSFCKPHSVNPDTRFININLAIYECESTGGSEWLLEDTIKLKNVVIPQSEASIGIQLEPLLENTLKNKKAADTLMSRLTSDDPTESRSNNIQRLLSVPSYSTMQSLKKIISEQGNQFTLTQKSAVQISWVSTEDGSHALTVSVGSNISVFTPVSTDIAQANLQAMTASAKTGTTSAARLMLKQASMGVSTLAPPDDIRWMAIRTTNLRTADSLPPLPMQMSWVRDGILVVGMDNEMHIYTQWKCQRQADKSPAQATTAIEAADIRLLSEKNLLSQAHQSSQLRLPTMPGLPRSPSSALLDKQHHTHAPTKTSPTDDNSASSEHHDNVFSEMPDFGIFEASRLACPVLPQYHPKQLMELLSFGKIQRVKAILRHLIASLCSMDSMKAYLAQQQQAIAKSPKPYRSRTMSISAPAGTPSVMTPGDNDPGFPNIPEEVQLEYTEITSIRPLPLFSLIEAEFETRPELKRERSKDGSTSESDSYGGLFDAGSKSQVEETLDEILNKSAFNFNTKKLEDIPTDAFGQRQALLLTKLLTHSHLPGLSSTDQMHLIALADAVASFNPDASAETSVDDVVVNSNSLDDCGLRFLLTIRQHTYLLRSLPLNQRKQLHKEGISTSNMVWAFHSEAQEELVQLIVKRGHLNWASLRELGLGWWIRNNQTLKKLIEQLAKGCFQAKSDPLDAALYYLAMKKKSLVWGLYRSIGDKRMTDFFQNNFAEDKWRKAALKNAYALLGKQRFDHAAAFFLLAGHVWDAVETCLSKLEDVQLAMVIVRLYEGDLETVPPTLKKILYQEVLGRDKEGEKYNPDAAHPDPFLRSMAYWILQDYSSSLTTLLESDVGCDHPKSTGVTGLKDDLWVHPSVFNFYLHLRTQPLIVRRHFAKSDKHDLSADSLALCDTITTFERRLFFITAHQHFRAGCPSLALEVLSRLPGKIVSDDDAILNRRDSQEEHPHEVATGNLPNGYDKPSVAVVKTDSVDWGQPEPKKEEMDFDWGAPVPNAFDDLEPNFKLEVDPASDIEDDDDGGLVMKSSRPPEKTPEPEKSKTSHQEFTLDIMAQQLKFIACLKIIMEELSTLATGYEVDGGQLRYYLYVWLEKTVNALKVICSYRTGRMKGFDAYKSMDQTSSVLAEEFASDRATPRGSHSDAGESKPTLHEILLQDKMDFEVKLERATKRKEWLRANEALLRTLLSYCSLHGAQGGGLASVRMELILLLQELQQEQNQHQLLSPLPFSTTLPLLAASVACQKTVIADPIRHLQCITHDIMQTMIDFDGPPVILPPNYSEVYVLRDLGMSLSACIYQSLCDSENLPFRGPKEQDGLGSSVVCPNSHLIAGQNAKTRSSFVGDAGSPPLVPTTPPNKWPGVQSLRALLAKDKDEDSPKLHTLLCEAYVSVYVSQLLYAFAACDSHMLYRLVAQTFAEKDWSALFGGGAKKLIHVAVATGPMRQASYQRGSEGSEDAGAAKDLMDTISKHRMNFNMKILQMSKQEKQIAAPHIREDKPTYREQFVSPRLSVLSFLMAKPKLPDELIVLDYDSSESVASEDDEVADVHQDMDDEYDVINEGADDGRRSPSDHEKYAWAIIRCAVIKLALIHVNRFLAAAGIEMCDLPTISPLIHCTLKTLNIWSDYMSRYMMDFGGPPAQFLPNIYVESNRPAGAPAITKYKALLELNNTPFKGHNNSVAKPAKRLWNYLVRQTEVQDIFVRHVFGKSHSLTDEPDMDVGVDDGPEHRSHEIVRIVHRDHDNISSFCINQTNSGIMAIATPKEIQEMNISALLEPVSWLKEEAEYDIKNLLRSVFIIPSDVLLLKTCLNSQSP